MNEQELQKQIIEEVIRRALAIDEPQQACEIEHNNELRCALDVLQAKTKVSRMQLEEIARQVEEEVRRKHTKQRRSQNSLKWFVAFLGVMLGVVMIGQLLPNTAYPIGFFALAVVLVFGLLFFIFLVVLGGAD